MLLWLTGGRTAVLLLLGSSFGHHRQHLLGHHDDFARRFIQPTFVFLKWR
jgi:hypothetical protein